MQVFFEDIGTCDMSHWFSLGSRTSRGSFGGGCEMREGAWASSPSPTRKWSSGFERILLVSIMGGIWPAPTAALYAAWVGYRGGGGRTLRAVISETSVIL